MTTSNDYPLYLYEYNAEGRYSDPLHIAGPAGLEFIMGTLVKTALAEKREVRIVDESDVCVFHARDGEIVWPKKEDCAP
jgi:hypothetical protein